MHLPSRLAGLALVFATGLLAVMATAEAQDGGDGLDIRGPDDSDITILPRPNSGSAPETPGDPGGWQQLTLLAVIVVALALIFFLVRRQARRARAGVPPSSVP